MDRLAFDDSDPILDGVFHLPDDMEAYYSALSKNERKNRRKYDLRLLKKEHDTRVDVVSDAASISEEFEHFAEQHLRRPRAEIQGKRHSSRF